ncbi:uncharacterized protein N7459_001637 [Penicillium hispanicum]|uniref:uncharacterized protein n=1 Tax=Penicillium hispanicum TaxID=1080232 RepID=UPI0025415FDB|nr:uncharacterized protein N7459_001637 [Penicillium hispanicum]KAJ5595429.1 hypothetical protein N7459_001637 [Penicillium hispanicum]
MDFSYVIDSEDTHFPNSSELPHREHVSYNTFEPLHIPRHHSRSPAFQAVTLPSTCPVEDEEDGARHRKVHGLSACLSVFFIISLIICASVLWASDQLAQSAQSSPPIVKLSPRW